MPTFYKKEKNCLNCGLAFSDNNNYCADCGQKNTNPKISFGTLVVDFLGDVFTFDSKIFKSLLYLIAKPGFLSQEFIEGRRVPYIPPLRMFIVLGVIFVAVLNRQIDFGEENLWDKMPTSSAELNEMAEEAKLKGDTLKIDGQIYTGKKGWTVKIEPGDEKKASSELSVNLPWGQEIFEESFELARETEKSTEEIAIEASATTYMERALSGQVVKLARKGPQELARWGLNNLSFLVLLMVPLCALIMKLLYIRHGIFTIDHLIFSLHQHSLVYLAALIATLIPLTGPLLFLILLPLYTFFAMKRVYKQSNWQTGIKQFLLAGTYSFVFLFVLIAFLFVSFFLF